MKTLKEFMLKPWLYLIIVLSSLILKVVTVDNRYFWRDEIYTIHHTSGNSEFSLNESAPLNEIKNISYYKQLLSLNERELTVSSQIKDLSKMPNLNPLHYYILVFWHRLVGDDDTHYRLFSIFMFLLCLPVLFLLTKQLFHSSLAAWITISLFALSPYFHFYAHEARYNILLAFVLISSHYMLLRAIDNNILKYWIGYTITGMLVLYSSLTAGIVLFGHFLFVMFLEKKVRKTYILAGVGILLGYLPWILSIINNRIEISNSLAWQYELKSDSVNQLRVLVFQIMSIGRSFVNFSLYAEWASYFFEGKLLANNIAQLLANIFVILVLVYSIIIAKKNLPKDNYWYLISLTFPLLLFLLIVDVIRSSMASIVDRYQLAVYLGTLIFISYLLYSKISQKRSNFVLLYLIFVVFGFISLSKIATDRQGLSIGTDTKIVSTANFISRAEFPLIVTNGNNPHFFWGEFLSLLNACESESIDILYADENIENVNEIISGNGYSNVYIVMVSNDLQKNLETQFDNKMIAVENNNIIQSWELQFNSN